MILVLSTDESTLVSVPTTDGGTRTFTPIPADSGGSGAFTFDVINEVACPANELQAIYDVTHTSQTGRVKIEYWVQGAATWSPSVVAGSGNLETFTTIDGTPVQLTSDREFVNVAAAKQSLWWSIDSGGTTGDYFSANNGTAQGTLGSLTNSVVAMPAAKRVRELRVDTIGGAAVGADVTVQVVVDGIPSAIGATIPTGSSSATDTTHDLFLVAGQQVAFQLTSATTGGQALVLSVGMFDPEPIADGSNITQGSVFGVFDVGTDEIDVVVYLSFGPPDVPEATWFASGWITVTDVPAA